jgi:hypothetical protein
VTGSVRTLRRGQSDQALDQQWLDAGLVRAKSDRDQGRGALGVQCLKIAEIILNAGGLAIEQTLSCQCADE